MSKQIKVPPDVALGVPVFQGEIMLVRVARLPQNGLTLEAHPIVGHSETGHHHVAEHARVFSTSDARTLYLEAIGRRRPVIRHLRPHDTHAPISLPSGSCWMVRRAREAIPEGWRIVAD